MKKKNVLMVSVIALLIIGLGMIVFRSVNQDPLSQLLVEQTRNVIDSLQAGDPQRAEAHFNAPYILSERYPPTDTGNYEASRDLTEMRICR